MTDVLDWPCNRYVPTEDAAFHELQLANDELETIRNLPLDENLNCVPLPDLDRFRAARERLIRTQDIARTARMRGLSQRLAAMWR